MLHWTDAFWCGRCPVRVISNAVTHAWLEGEPIQRLLAAGAGDGMLSLLLSHRCLRVSASCACRQAARDRWRNRRSGQASQGAPQCLAACLLITRGAQVWLDHRSAVFFREMKGTCPHDPLTLAEAVYPQRFVRYSRGHIVVHLRRVSVQQLLLLLIV